MLDQEDKKEVIFGYDSALKVLEISAQQIVDRIGNPNLPHLDELSQKALIESSPKSEEDDKINENVNNHENAQLSPDSTRSPSSQSQSSHLSKTSFEFKPSKKALKQLEILHGWIHDASREKNSSEKFQIPRGLSNNLYFLSSIELFIRELPHITQKALAEKFSAQLLAWIKKLFNFKAQFENELEYNTIFAHWEKNEGIVAITKFSLYQHFPNYLNYGYETFYQENRFPRIYSSDEEIGSVVTSHLGISGKCVKLVDPQNPDWVNILEQSIRDDLTHNLVPIILLLNIGKASSNLEKGVKVAEQFKIHVHLFGRNTFSYFVKRPETSQLCSSFTINLKNWIPSPPLPFLTIYKKGTSFDKIVFEASGLSSISRDLSTLSSWFCSQVYGFQKTIAGVDELCQKGQFLLTTLKKYDFLQIVPNWSVLSDGKVLVSSLLFRYEPNTKPNGTENLEKKIDKNPSAEYISVLNSWLFHILERDLKEYLPVELVEIKKIGWYILFEVFKSDKLSGEDEEFLDRLFRTHMRVLQATVSKKCEFSELVRQSSELEWVEYEGLWAGLGAVRFIPKFYRDKTNGVGDDDNNEKELLMKSNINHLNAQIVEKLKSIDGAFTLGTFGDGDWCIQFGMVTDETDVSQLLRLVTSTGEEIEESSEFFNQMSELVKKGIEKATEELRKESEEALWEEGILRRVPVINTFVNWWSPPVKESGIRGRALNLVEGRVESTENIYKYHMQLQSPSPQQPPSSQSNNSNI